MVKRQEQAREAVYARVCQTLVPPLAIFCLCAAYDLPYHAALADSDTWEEYEDAVRKAHGGETFADGETDYGAAELAGMDRDERWRSVWGEGYSENEYTRLDDLYRTMTAQLDAAGGLIDKQQEDTARYCSQLALQREKLTRKGDKESIDMAAKLDKMIRDNLKDCNMRKADVLPSQKQRLDGFVDALRKKCGLDAEMTQEDVLHAFYRWCKRKRYPMTTDAADHALLSILRTMAKNDDLPEPTDLEPRMRFAPFASEFTDEPNAQEIENYDYLGLVRGEFAPEDDG